MTMTTQMEEANDSRYLKSVTSLGDTRNIVNESFRQIGNLERELNRLWPDFEKAADADKQTLKDWICRYTGSLH